MKVLIKSFGVFNSYMSLRHRIDFCVVLSLHDAQGRTLEKAIAVSGLETSSNLMQMQEAFNKDDSATNQILFLFRPCVLHFFETTVLKGFRETIFYLVNSWRSNAILLLILKQSSDRKWILPGDLQTLGHRAMEKTRLPLGIVQRESDLLTSLLDNLKKWNSTFDYLLDIYGKSVEVAA